jgi:hypothetical protein
MEHGVTPAASHLAWAAATGSLALLHPNLGMPAGWASVREEVCMSALTSRDSPVHKLELLLANGGALQPSADDLERVHTAEALQWTIDHLAPGALQAYFKLHGWITLQVAPSALEAYRYFRAVTPRNALLSYAVARGDAAGTLLLIRNGHPVHGGLCALAAYKGHTEVLRQLLSHGVTPGADACSNAAAAGNLDCLVLLHEMGAPWDGRGDAGCRRVRSQRTVPQVRPRVGLPLRRLDVRDAASLGRHRLHRARASTVTRLRRPPGTGTCRSLGCC